LPPNQAWDFCSRILVGVSRSFAIIIPECPPPIDRAMSIAYLLCRIADTIEDEPSLDDARRAILYDTFLAAVDRPDDESALRAFLAAWPPMSFSEAGYGDLVAGTGMVLSIFREFPAELTSPIRRCVHDMVAGMRTVRFVEIKDGLAFICRDLAGLDAYCHIVAGTVGIMSTSLFARRFASTQPAFVPTDAWREEGRQLGLGLQMTNILKDCRVDAERGVSFVPSTYVERRGGTYQLAASSRLALFRHAIGYLDAGMRYTLAVPREENGIRRFLLGSLMPAIATLEIAAPGTEYHPKIHRDKMAEILDLIVDPATTDAALNEWYAAHRSRALAEAQA
jgi:farnesyl-diphosphate farnesyltransferase